MIETHNTNPVETKPRRWFRFRLRSLLVMVTLLSVPLGWVGWELDQRRREKATIAWVEELGGQVNSHFPIDERNWWEKTKDNWLGERVRLVDLSRTQVSDISPLAELKNLKLLHISYTQVSDLSPLSELKSLHTLYLYRTQVSDLSPLAELKNLGWLNLCDTQVSDLSPLAGLKDLSVLFLNETQMTEEQVQELRLALPNCQISSD